MRELARVSWEDVTRVLLSRWVELYSEEWRWRRGGWTLACHIMWCCVLVSSRQNQQSTTSFDLWPSLSLLTSSVPLVLSIPTAHKSLIKSVVLITNSSPSHPQLLTLSSPTSRRLIPVQLGLAKISIRPTNFSLCSSHFSIRTANLTIPSSHFTIHHIICIHFSPIMIGSTRRYSLPVLMCNDSLIIYYIQSCSVLGSNIFIVTQCI